MKLAEHTVGVRMARRWLTIAVAVIAVLTAWASSARAADPYGEIARWGATGTDRIGEAAGFAADPVDDSVYVADVQSRDTDTGVTTFRLRKFTGLDGALLGTATFTSSGPLASAPPAIAGMTVDHAARHVYLTLVAPPSENAFVALQQIKVFSTEVDGGSLRAPADVADGDLLDTVPNVIYNVPVTVDPATSDA